MYSMERNRFQTTEVKIERNLKKRPASSIHTDCGSLCMSEEPKVSKIKVSSNQV